MHREYLYDTSFLKELDQYRNKFYYVKIIVLDMQERPISEIHGRVQDGSSINIDGNSAVRRTCNLNFIALEKENDLTDIDNLLSTNKKIKVEVGIVNNFHNKYDDDIFWFPQGIFIIIDPSISNNSGGCSISLSCKDKMALLNGECGGNLPASVTFHAYDQVIGLKSVDTWPTGEDLNNYTLYDFGTEVKGSQYWRWSKELGFYEGSLDMVNGDPESISNLVYDIIQTLVCNYGGESLDKIIINDVPLEIKQRVRNAGGNSIFYNPSNGLFSENQTYAIDSSGDWIEFKPGKDCGYRYTDFTYPGVLVSGIGENVCSVLDKIKNTLGNYEYFYDIDGNFVFQEIKNYLNVSYLPVANAKMTILMDYTSGKFNHYLDNIENLDKDETRRQFIVETINNQNIFNLQDQQSYNYSISYPSVEHITKRILVCYMPETHSWEIANNLYLIDQNNYLVDYNSNKKSSYDFDVENGMITNFSNSPKYTNIKNDFHVWGKVNEGSFLHYHLVIKEKPKMGEYYKVQLLDDGQLKVVTEDEPGHWYLPTDWRVEVYLRGKKKVCENQIRPDVYEQEMMDLLPSIYSFKEEDGKIVGSYIDDITKTNEITYFVDYLEPEDKLNECSVDLIGTRVYSYQQDNIIKMFDDEVPNIIIINRKSDDSYVNDIRRRCEKEGQVFVNVDENIYNNIDLGTLGYSAQEVARDLLYQYTDYNSAITFSCSPIFYLEPNTRITVRDRKSGIYGDYIITNISRPLSGQGTMTITATRALEKI